MSAQAQPLEVRFEPLTLTDLDGVMRIERLSYGHPWSRGVFEDSIASGYQMQRLLAGNALLAYFVAMLGVDEVHLLNMTVAPSYRNQGWARVMLEALSLWSRGQGAKSLLLEVRVSNSRAIGVYEASGFARIGRRKSYYASGRGQREDAWVMRLAL